jgi:hypothetical protein
MVDNIDGNISSDQRDKKRKRQNEARFIVDNLPVVAIGMLAKIFTPGNSSRQTRGQIQRGMPTQMLEERIVQNAEMRRNLDQRGLSLYFLFHF